MDHVHILFNNDAPHHGYESLDQAEGDARALQNKSEAEKQPGFPPSYWHTHTVPFTAEGNAIAEHWFALGARWRESVTTTGQRQPPVAGTAITEAFKKAATPARA